MCFYQVSKDFQFRLSGSRNNSKRTALHKSLTILLSNLPICKMDAQFYF